MELIGDELAGTDAAGSVHNVHRVLVAANHLLQMINEVLDLAKIEAGKMRAEHIAVRYPDLLADVADTVRPLARKNDKRLIVDIAPELGTGCTDPLKLRQCLLNLLGNALKFTSNGEVRLTAGHVAATDMVEITVADTGIGMSGDQMAQLFRPFVQASASTTRLYGGTGLGLAITHHLAQLLGGDVTARSTEGVGSWFTLQIPRDATTPTRVAA